MKRGKRGSGTPRRKRSAFDVIVIGGGSAGLAAAESARRTVARVCVVEREALGGDCPHWSCVPTKALLQSAKMFAACKRAAQFGVVAEQVRFSFANIVHRKAAVVRAVTGNDVRLERWAEQLGITVLHGDASFVDAHTIAVGEARFTARAFVIATGSREVVPPVAGLADIAYLTPRAATSLTKLPASVLIIGGGPVGCEFAMLFGTLESRVVLCDPAPHILSREEPELAAMAAAQLRGIGVDVHEKTKVLSVHPRGKRFAVTFQRGTQRRQTVVMDAVLLAAGRAPHVDGLNVPKGKHIIFAGDAAGGAQFTHVAHYQGMLAGRMAAAGRKRQFAVPVTPRVTFVQPELASVGMTEAEARAAGFAVRIGRTAVGALSRAVIDGERDGMLKVVLDATSDRILGAHMLGESAGEVIHELALAMHLGAAFDDVARMLHAFPTYSEAIAACQFEAYE